MNIKCAVAASLSLAGWIACGGAAQVAAPQQMKPSGGECAVRVKEFGDFATREANVRNALASRAKPGPLVIGLADVCEQGGKPRSVSPYATYSKAIYAAGHVPLMLPHTEDGAAAGRALEKIDVLLLCGGEDVETSRYGEVCTNSCAPNLVRDSWEWMLLDKAVQRRLPVVGICRGLQVINVYFGGSLYQDLVKEFPGAGKHREDESHSSVHQVSIEPASRIGRILGAKELSFVSWHHQGVKRLAPGFRIAARAPDGFVEAIEADGYPAAGVQFHPELTYASTGDEVALAVFRNVLEWAGAANLDAR